MKQYIEAIEYILDKGTKKGDRTGVGTTSVFGMQQRYDLRDGFPAVTTKKLAWEACVAELLWFLEGSTDERRLAEIRFNDSRENLIDKKTIWTANADAQGKALNYENSDLRKELGPVYGKQWRDFGGIDQLKDAITTIKEDPDSRRIIINSWNTAELNQMALPPCPVLIQFEVSNGVLNSSMYQRSADFFLGVPLDIACYSLLTHIIAQICDLGVGEFIHTTGDAHIYLNHSDAINEQLTRTPKKLPTLKMPEFKTLEEVLELSVQDFVLEDYNHGSVIRAPMAV